MTKPQFALIPSAYRVSKVYSVLPVDGSGDMTFYRNGEATRVREDGLIEDVSSNIPRLNWLNSNCPSLLLEPQSSNGFGTSQDFTSSFWVKTGLTISSNLNIAPDGTSTANEIFETSATSSKFLYQDTSVETGNKYTVSYFVKHENSQYIQLTGSTGFNLTYVNFDILNGEITRNLDNADATIENYNNGWYRISLTLEATSTTNGRILLSLIPSATSFRVESFTGNTSNLYYIWGGQMEQKAFATSYISTSYFPTTRNIGSTYEATLPYNKNEGTIFLDVKAFNNDGSSVIRLGDNGANVISFTFSTNNNLFILINNAYSSPIASYTYSHAQRRQKYAVKWQGDNYYIYINGLLVISATNTGRTFSNLLYFNFTSNYGFNNFQGEVYNTQIFDVALSNDEIINLTK